MEWFPVLLLGALVLSIVLSLWQHRRYLAVLNGMAKANAGLPLNLVSGRSKGRLRGAVVVLLIDPAAGRVVDARAMSGATIFSQLKPAPQLLGSLDDVVERAGDTHIGRATEAALDMLAKSAPAPKAGSTRIRIPRVQSDTN